MYMLACNEGRIGAVGSRFLTDEAEVPGLWSIKPTITFDHARWCHQQGFECAECHSAWAAAARHGRDLLRRNFRIRRQGFPFFNR